MWRVRRLLGRDVTANVVAALVITRLDYGNALSAGLPYSSVAPYQRVINVAVRIVCDHMTMSHKRRLICTGYRRKHVSSISVAYWSTTLLPARHLHISLTFFNPSPSCHLVIQFCDLQLSTVYTCRAPDCCLASEPSESPLPRCGISSHTTSALNTNTFKKKNWKLAIWHERVYHGFVLARQFN